MTKRVLLALGMLLAACGDSGGSDSDDDLRRANRLTADEVEETGEYCCYENGRAMEDSPALCGSGQKDCIFSETESDVDMSGRGTLCGYLACE